MKKKTITTEAPRKKRYKKIKSHNPLCLGGEKKTAINLSAMLKQAAFEGKTVAQAELELQTELPTSNFERPTSNKGKKQNQRKPAESVIKNLNDLFTARPELKAAWERGRFLKQIADYAGTLKDITEVEIALAMKVGELRTMLTADFEVAETWNNARHKKRMEIQAAFLAKNIETCSINAIKQIDKFFSRDIARPIDEDDIAFLSSAQLIKKTGVSRQTLEVDWPKKYGLPRNPDGTYTLGKFLRWIFQDYIPRKTAPGRPPETVQNSLQSIKAKQLQLELEEQSGNLIPRSKVIAGYIARNQTLIGVFSKFIGGETEPFVKQKLEKIYEDIRRELAGNMPDLKLDEKQQAMLKELLELPEEDIKNQKSNIKIMESPAGDGV